MVTGQGGKQGKLAPAVPPDWTDLMGLISLDNLSLFLCSSCIAPNQRTLLYDNHNHLHLLLLPDLHLTTTTSIIGSGPGYSKTSSSSSSFDPFSPPHLLHFDFNCLTEQATYLHLHLRLHLYLHLHFWNPAAVLRRCCTVGQLVLLHLLLHPLLLLHLPLISKPRNRQ